MQMRARRQELHARALEAVENLYANDLKVHYAELAYHSEFAELRAKAQGYYTLAGKVAAEAYQNYQAIDYFTRALAFTPFDDLPTQFSLLVQRMELFNRLGDRAAQSNDLDALEKLALQLNDPQHMAKVDMLFAHYYLLTGDYPAVVERSEHVMKFDRRIKDAEIAMDTYRIWSLALLRQGKLEEAIKAAQQGRQLAKLHADRTKEAYLLNSMGLIAIEQKDPAVAHAYLEPALLIARETGDRRLEVMTLGNLGNWAAYVRQDYAAARQYYEQVYILMHEHGEHSTEAAALVNLGWLAGMQGDFPSARSYQERALLLAREVGNLYLETYTLINLSAITSVTNDGQDSRTYAERALMLAKKAGDRSGEAWALLYMGYADVLLQDLVQAEDAFRQSVTIREELGQLSMKNESLAGLIQVYLHKDDPVSAMLTAEEILAYLNEGGTLEGTEEPLRVYYVCYLTLEKAKDPRAQTVLQSGAQLLEAQVSKLPNETTRRVYVENVPWRMAIQEAWRARTNLSKDRSPLADPRG
jgi:tetratricopeptide (TPR) repeat protein